MHMGADEFDSIPANHKLKIVKTLPNSSDGQFSFAGETAWFYAPEFLGYTVEVMIGRKDKGVRRISSIKLLFDPDGNEMDGELKLTNFNKRIRDLLTVTRLIKFFEDGAQ